MSRLILLFSLLNSIFSHVKAQSSSPLNNPPSKNAAGSNLDSIAAVIAVLLTLSILLTIYFKFWHKTASLIHNNQQTVGGSITRPNPQSSGIDKTVIESIPFFKFSSLRGLRGGMECVVCLSKFEDIEVLRLLPKCKHAFHINCVDKWLENHSTCPLCRHTIMVEDLVYSNSLRILTGQVIRSASNAELFVQREDSRRIGSSRFSIRSSFRIFEGTAAREDELPMRNSDVDENDKFFHKFNHKIIMSDAILTKKSDAVLKTRWSNLSSSDLLFLNSERLGEVSGKRLSPLDSDKQESEILKIEYKNGSKREFEKKFGKLSENDSHPLSNGLITSKPMRNLHSHVKRSMSEIAARSFMI